MLRGFERSAESDAMFCHFILRKFVWNGRMILRSLINNRQPANGEVHTLICASLAGGIGGVMYYQKKTAASLAEGEQVEGEGDAEAKEEPAEGADDEKEEEEG